MPPNPLPTPYHQQDTDDSCGAACAQMVLASVGAGLLDQGDLYDENHDNGTLEDGWSSPPDGVEWTLNHHAPTAGPFVLFALDDEDRISRKIVWTIYNSGVAPIALVEGMGHWVVVVGYDASAHPASSTDTAYVINGFYLHNPSPPVSGSSPPPPHSSTDGCGTRGLPNTHITRACWVQEEMTGVPRGYWRRKFLAVCDSAPAPRYCGPVPHFEPRSPRQEILPPELVLKRAVDGMREHHLDRQSGWREALADPHAVGGEPLLVRRLDRPDRSYYLVEVRSATGPAVVASVDARFGDYRRSSVRRTEEPMLRKLDGDQLLDRLEPYRTMLRELPRGGVVPGRDALSISPWLVWRPCRESLSPFYPFHLVTIGRWRLFLRIDGQLFTRLTPMGRGL